PQHQVGAGGAVPHPAEVVPIRVFGARLETSAAVLAAAVRWGAAEGLHLLNLSLGTLAIHGVVPLYAACEGARRGGTTVVAAVHAGRGWSYPAIFANAIGVGALEGAERALEVRPDEAVECLAPAEHDGVRAPGGALRRVRGTSFAAPVVTGIAARLLERSPGAGLEEVRELLRRFASECVSA
ncbi:MAG TPA: S8 family serine peptidase, partial [Longimicrobium sp.]|nr:S8 family serine peptidase [Longimicrobium sp.]